MKKTAVQQTTFQGGMLEGIKQDVPFEAGGGALTSVLWLENYNHTLQQDSAIKRWGEVDSGVPLLDLGYFTPNMTYSYVVNGGNTLEIDRSTWLQGVQMYSVVHPEYNDNYTTFLKRYPNTTATYAYDYIPDYVRNAAVLHTVESSEAVAVVSHTIAKDGDTAEWQEVWADGITDYPGWYTFGTLADVTRYGETLLFTTTLRELPYFSATQFPDNYPEYENPVNQYLYPVYRYLYWDITQKWKGENQFLNGIEDYDFDHITDDKFHHWKVLPPAQYVVNNIQVGITRGMVQDTSTAMHTSGATSTFDINIGIEECSAAARFVDTAGTGYDTLAEYKPAWSAVVFQTSYTAYDGTSYTNNTYVPQQRTQSMEELDLASMNRILYGVEPAGATFNLSFGNTNHYDARRVTAKQVQVGFEIKEADVIYGSYSGVRFLPIITGTSLIKYTATRSPRLWLYGERFDLILTANIAGVEVLVKRMAYEVQTKPTNEYADIPTYVTANTRILPFLINNEMTTNMTIEGNGTPVTFNEEVVDLGKFFPQARCIGAKEPTATSQYDYLKYQAYGMLLYFSLEVSAETMQALIDASCSALSLWCIKPDSNQHITKSIGYDLSLPSGNIYNKPLDQDSAAIDYTKYALLKRFVIDGRTDPPADYEDWIPSATLATNSWVESSWTGGSSLSNTYYVGVPLNRVSGDTLEPNSTVPLYATDTAVKTYLDNVVSVSANVLDTDYWTPDFVLWDYPTETTLFLNSSGKYWKGLGAKLITVIKGRTFIGGCIGADGIEEQAILRYSDVQGGAISPDIFSEERKIQVGHIPHTALLEFREQLWAFSRYQFYRIGLASITQEETWEFFDVVEQGCFNNKSVVVVPYGVVFCNEAGVWLSEGGEPQNLALPILPTYQNISSGTNYLYTNINELAGVPYIDSKGINPYLELNYDSFNDEILISSPLFTTVQNDDNDTDYLPNTDFTMIFSFKYKTWRIESSAVPQYEVEIQ